MLVNEPTGLLSEHANTKNFATVSPIADLYGNDVITHEAYNQLFQYVAQDTPQSGQSVSGDVERKWQLDRDMNRPKTALIIHQGIRNNDNFVLKRVLPWKQTDQLVYKKETIVFDWNDIHITPYGTYNGNVTSSEHETITRLQRYGHGVEFDRTMVRGTSGPKGQEYFRAQYAQLFKDIITAATLMALRALKDARSPDEYYRLAFGSFEEEAENTVRKEASAFLCFARSNEKGTNEMMPYLSLGIDILKNAGYTPNILIYPQNANALIIRNMEPKQISYYDFNVLENTLNRMIDTQSLNIVEGTDIAVYTTPQIRLHKYAQRAREDLTHIHEEIASISEFYEMSMSDVDDLHTFSTEHVGIDIFSYVKNNWERIKFDEAFTKCEYFHFDEKHNKLGWNPAFVNWLARNAHKNEEMGTGMHAHQSVFSKSVPYKNNCVPVDYIGDIKIGEGVNEMSYKGFMKMAACVAGKLRKLSPRDISDVFSSGLHIMRNIADAEPDANYIDELITANPNGKKSGKDVPEEWKKRIESQFAATNVSEINRNAYGFIDLPPRGNREYPAGFCSFPGLKTISVEYNKTGAGSWQELGKRVKPFVDLIETIDGYLKTLLPHSILNNKDNIPHYFWTNDTSTLLLQSLMNQYGPTFLKLGTSQTVAPPSPKSAYITSINDNALLKGLDDKFKERISTYINTQTNDNPKFDPTSFLANFAESDVKKLSKANDEKVFEGILNDIYIRVQSTKSITAVTPSGTKKVAVEIKKDDNVDDWYRSPLSATHGIINYVKRTPATRVLPADPNLNFNTYVAQGDVKSHAGFARIHEHLKTENWAASMKNLVAVSQTYKKTGASVFSFGEARDRASSKSHSGIEHNASFSDNLSHNVDMLMHDPEHLDKIIAMYLLFSTEVPATLHHLLKKDCCIPFNVMLFRPMINIRTAATILCAAGNASNAEEDSPLGYVLYIQGYPERTVVQGGNVRDNFYWDMAAMIENPERIWVQHNAIPVKVISGLNVGWIKPGDASNLHKMRNMEDKNGNMGSLVSIVTSDNFDSKLDILNIIMTEHGRDNYPPGCAYFDQRFHFTSTSTRISQQNSSNAFGRAMQGTFFTRDPHTKQWAIRHQGSGHLGDLVYQGASAAFRAEVQFRVNYKGR